MLDNLLDKRSEKRETGETSTMMQLMVGLRLLKDKKNHPNPNRIHTNRFYTIYVINVQRKRDLSSTSLEAKKLFFPTIFLK